MAAEGKSPIGSNRALRAEDASATATPSHEAQSAEAD
jgi:hypothetical protein